MNQEFNKKESQRYWKLFWVIRSSEELELLKSVVTDLSEFCLVGCKIAASSQKPYVHATLALKEGLSFWQLKAVFVKGGLNFINLSPCIDVNKCLSFSMKDGFWVSFGVLRERFTSLQDVPSPLHFVGSKEELN
jgi:hypothetical protein